MTKKKIPSKPTKLKKISPFIKTFGETKHKNKNPPKHHEILTKIMHHLPNEKKIDFALTDRRLYGLFESEKIFFLAKILLDYVARGEQKKAKQFLKTHFKNYPNLIFIKSNTTDYSGRTFPEISSFQMAFYTGDMEMLAMLKRFIDKLQDGSEQALTQIGQLENHGIISHCPTITGQIKTENLPHCDNDLLQSAYQNYLTFYQTSVNNGEIRENNYTRRYLLNLISWIEPYWKQINYAQKMLPAWQAQTFCQPDGCFNYAYGFDIHDPTMFNALKQEIETLTDIDRTFLLFIDPFDYGPFNDDNYPFEPTWFPLNQTGFRSAPPLSIPDMIILTSPREIHADFGNAVSFLFSNNFTIKELTDYIKENALIYKALCELNKERLNDFKNEIQQNYNQIKQNYAP